MAYSARFSLCSKVSLDGATRATLISIVLGFPGSDYDVALFTTLDPLSSDAIEVISSGRADFGIHDLFQVCLTSEGVSQEPHRTIFYGTNGYAFWLKGEQQLPRLEISLLKSMDTLCSLLNCLWVGRWVIEHVCFPLEQSTLLRYARMCALETKKFPGNLSLKKYAKC